MLRLEHVRVLSGQLGARIAALPIGAGLVPALVLLVLASSLVLLSPGPYVTSIATLALIYFIAALGYNFVLSIVGLFHFGFAVHFAIGGYMAAFLMVRFYRWEFLPTLLVVMLASGLITAVIAWPTLRFVGDYLAMVSLAFAEIVRRVLVNWFPVTRGSLGISGIPLPAFFGFTSTSAEFLFVVVVGLATFALLVYQILICSRYGLAWEAIRLNEEAAAAGGVRLWRFKFGALVAGGVFGGVSGMAYAHYSSIVEPSMSSLDVTVQILAIAILGGGNWLGILLSSIVLISLPQIFLDLGLYRQLALGLILILAMNLRPEGFSLLRRRQFAQVRHKSAGVVKRAGSSPDKSEAATARPFAPLQLSELGPNTVGPTTTPQFTLETQGVVKRFGGLVAVDDLSVKVPMGCLFGIIGPNGAGKTTLFNIINGVFTPDEGVVKVLGHDVTAWPVWRIGRLGVGRTFQNIKLYRTLSAVDNVLAAAALPAHGRPLDGHCWRDAMARAFDSLEFVGLAGQAHVLAGALPYAHQRRLEIARAIVGQPKLLLLDEPAAGMNPKELESLAILIEKIQGGGITIVCIEHNMRFILPIADEVLVMLEGKSLIVDRPNVIASNPAVIEAYLGRRVLGAAR